MDLLEKSSGLLGGEIENTERVIHPRVWKECVAGGEVFPQRQKERRNSKSGGGGEPLGRGVQSEPGKPRAGHLHASPAQLPTLSPSPGPQAHGTSVPNKTLS